MAPDKLYLVHDWIDNVGGAEKVLDALVDLTSPEKLLVLLANPESPFTERYRSILKTSFLQKIPKAFSWHRYLLPIYPWAIESMSVEGADLILSSSHCVAKGILRKSEQFHLSYIHSPPRYLWDLREEYLEQTSLAKRLFAEIFFKSLREWDVVSANRVDLFIANSLNVARRIGRTYRRNAIVLYPFYESKKWEAKPSATKKDYFVVLSRLVQQKRVDVAVEACRNLNLPLKIIGSGPEFSKLEKMAGSKTEFLGRLEDKRLAEVVSEAQALIFPTDEDFGIVPLEAQALGTPVVALGKGGALETVIAGKTGEFFEKQTATSLEEALRKFDPSFYHYDDMKVQTQKFSYATFRREFLEIFELVKEKRRHATAEKDIFEELSKRDHWKGKLWIQS